MMENMGAAEQLVNIIINYGSGDSFWGIKKLVDIYLFMKEKTSEIDWSAVKYYLNGLDLGHLYVVIYKLLKDYLPNTPRLFNETKKSNLLYKTLQAGQILSLKKGIQYYYVKHLSSADLVTALEYDIKWLGSRLKKNYDAKF